MTTMFAKHKVSDFNTWKNAYDEFAPFRNEMSVAGASVHRDVNDPNVVTVIHIFGSLDAATAFVNSDELKSAMMDAGVVGPPDIWFTEDVE